MGSCQTRPNCEDSESLMIKSKEMKVSSCTSKIDTIKMSCLNSLVNIETEPEIDEQIKKVEIHQTKQRNSIEYNFQEERTQQLEQILDLDLPSINQSQKSKIIGKRVNNFLTPQIVKQQREIKQIQFPNYLMNQQKTKQKTQGILKTKSNLSFHSNKSASQEKKKVKFVLEKKKSRQSVQSCRFLYK